MKKQLIGAALVLGAMAVAVPAAAQDAKAAEILGRTRKALGDGKLDGLTSITLHAATQRNVGSMQMTSDVEIAVEMPDKYVRNEVSNGMMGAMTLNTGFNGDKAIMPAGAMSSAPGGAMVIRMGPGGMIPNDGPGPTPEQQEQMNKAALRSQRTEVSRLMLGWFAMTHPSIAAHYTFAGEAESPDGKAFVIEVKDADGFAARLFIDQNNYLPLMVTYQGRQPRVVTAGGPGAGGQVRTETRPLSDEEKKKLEGDAGRMHRQMADAPSVEFSMFFDDWREVDGVQFPHVMRRGSGGETNEEWTISKVKINPKIDAKKFALDTK
jgi:hypothetical protein